VQQLGPVLALILAGPSSGQVSSQSTQLRIKPIGRGFVLSELRTPSGTGWASAVGGTELLRSAKVDGRTVPIPWRLTSLARTKKALSLRFTASPLHLSAVSEWKATNSPGPIEHRLVIVNGSTRPVVLPLQPSLSWVFERPGGHRLEEWWVEKDAGRPSLTGVHEVPIGANYARTVLSEPYESDQRAYSKDWRDRDSVPWVSVWDRTANEGWYAGIEFSGRVSLRLESAGGRRLRVSLGLAEEDKGRAPFETLVRPGESYALPTVFLGCYGGSVDDGCNQMRHWVDRELRPRVLDARYPLLNLDSWGSNMAINASVADRMMRNASNLGIEQFQVDAGWYRSVGDWRADLVKFPKGMAGVADEAHALGLKFGLWVGWTQGGNAPDQEDRDRVLSVHGVGRGDWFTQDYPGNWKPADYTGANLCLGDPDAVAWCTNLLTDMVREDRLDMLEHDQQMLVDACTRTDHTHTASKGDIAYRAALGYYAVYDALRAKYPALLFENCVNGGRNVDFGAARRAHYFSIVDSYDPLSNRQAMYDMAYVLPPAMCECYVQAMPVKTLPEFRNMLRSGLMGWFSLMQDPSKWTPAQLAAARQEFGLYKTRLRPLIRYGNVYHVSPRPNGFRWDGMEYLSPDRRKGVLYAFRGATRDASHTFALRGLFPGRLYHLHFQDPGQVDFVARGADLTTRGITVGLSSPGTSQLVFFSS
jgi:hypothetical protein